MKENIKWSGSYPLFNSQENLGVSGKPGVYRIRAIDCNGEFLFTHRLGGIDTEGILHIGKSKNLGRRIRTFRQAAEGLKASHHAGLEFFHWGFDNVIPRERIHFDHFETGSEQESLKLERLLHEEYRKKYLDRPPFDGTSGQAGD
jgi:hypothetical protein